MALPFTDPPISGPSAVGALHESDPCPVHGDLRGPAAGGGAAAPASGAAAAAGIDLIETEAAFNDPVAVVVCGLLGQGFILIPVAQRLGLTRDGGEAENH